MRAPRGAAGLVAAFWLRPRRGVHALLAVLTALWLGYSLIGYPLLNDASSSRGLMQAVGQRIGPQAELALVAWKEQNLLMADRPARVAGDLSKRGSSCKGAERRNGLSTRLHRALPKGQAERTLPCLSR